MAVATHGDIVRILLSHFEGAPLDAFQRTVVDTASVSVVTIDNGAAHIHLVNDTGAWSGSLPQRTSRTGHVAWATTLDATPPSRRLFHSLMPREPRMMRLACTFSETSTI